MNSSIINNLKWNTEIIPREDNFGYDATFSFSLKSAPKKIIEQLVIQIENGFPKYDWRKNAFPAGMKEYLEYKCQDEMDSKLQSMERSELRS